MVDLHGLYKNISRVVRLKGLRSVVCTCTNGTHSVSEVHINLVHFLGTQVLG